MGIAYGGVQSTHCFHRLSDLAHVENLFGTNPRNWDDLFPRNGLYARPGDLAHLISCAFNDFNIQRNQLWMSADVDNCYGGLRDNDAEIAKALKRVSDSTSKFADLLIVETTTYQPRPDRYLLARRQLSHRRQVHLRDYVLSAHTGAWCANHPQSLTVGTQVTFALEPKAKAALLDEEGKEFKASVVNKMAKQSAH